MLSLKEKKNVPRKEDKTDEMFKRTHLGCRAVHPFIQKIFTEILTTARSTALCW